MHITREDGLISVAQAAELCGVEAVTVRAWTQRGYGPKGARRKLPVAKREGGLVLLDLVEVAKAERATRKRGRRSVPRPLLASSPAFAVA